MVKNKLVGVISLGCDKNTTDTEKMLSFLRERHGLTSELENAEIVVINTCAFLKSAREEAIGEILSTSLLKDQGKLEKLIITGCLPQKFIGEIFDSLPEVDAFLGVSDYDKILDVIDRVYQGERVNAVGTPSGECTINRVRTTDSYAYLKIADGCSNHCTYCLIPSIRGAYRSVKKDMLIQEAKALGDVNELILVAQDVTKYGQDLEDKSSLPELIRALSSLDNVGSIRLLYCYPEGITEELIAEFKNNPKLIKYIDIPLQHADDRILKLMNRKGTGAGYLRLIERLKSEISGIAIRSTFITGFPTEDETAYNNLVEFIKKAKLFNAGFFKYSKEDGTSSAKLGGQVLASVKTKRHKKLYSVQKQIVKENAKSLIGKTFNVVAEGFDQDQLVYYGRAYFSAPNIDGRVYFFSADEVEYGVNYKVRIDKATDYDLYGEKL